MNLKPSFMRIFLTLIIAAFIYVLLTITSLEIFPCYYRAVIPGAEFRAYTCTIMEISPIGTIMLMGAQFKNTFISVIMLIILQIIIPYLLACLLVKKK